MRTPHRHTGDDEARGNRLSESLARDVGAFRDCAPRLAYLGLAGNALRSARGLDKVGGSFLSRRRDRVVTAARKQRGESFLSR